MQRFILKYQQYFNKYTLLGSSIIFFIFIIIVLPAESAKSLSLGLEISPDTSIFYTASKLYEIADSYGVEGRRFYMHQRFTFDLIWPIVYGSFLFISSVFFYHRIHLSKWFIHFLWLPLISVIFDFLENAMTSLVMYNFPSKTYAFDALAGIMTLFKWITLGFSFVMLLFWIGVYLYQTLQKQTKK